MKYLTTTLLVFISLESNALSNEDCSVVTMTGNPDYAPVTWSPSPDELIGSYIDFTKAIFDELGVESESVEKGNWRRAQEEVKNGKVDMLIGPWFNTERAEWLEYVEPEVSLDPAAIFMASSASFAYEKMDDLKGKQGVVQRGNSFGSEFDTFAEKNLSINYVSSTDQAFSMLAAGRADYVIGGLYSGRLLVESLGFSGKILASNNYLTEDKMYIAFSKKSPCKHLSNKMSPIINRLKSEGLIEKLTEKYINIYSNRQ